MVRMRGAEAIVVPAVLALSVAASAQGGGCARTPAAAVEMAAVQVGRLEHGAGPVGDGSGYRVRAVRWDPLQRQSWAVVESCGHPELATMAVLTKLQGPFTAARSEAAAVPPMAVAPVAAVGETVSAAVIRANAAIVLVKAGDAVRLWKADERAHIELMGTAEENGVVGAKVRVRLATAKEADGTTGPPQFLAGVVRGPADVEIER